MLGGSGSIGGQHGDHSERPLGEAREDVHEKKYDEQTLTEKVVIQLADVRGRQSGWSHLEVQSDVF